MTARPSQTASTMSSNMSGKEFLWNQIQTHFRTWFWNIAKHICSTGACQLKHDLRLSTLTLPVSWVALKTRARNLVIDCTNDIMNAFNNFRCIFRHWRGSKGWTWHSWSNNSRSGRSVPIPKKDYQNAMHAIILYSARFGQPNCALFQVLITIIMSLIIR